MSLGKIPAGFFSPVEEQQALPDLFEDKAISFNTVSFPLMLERHLFGERLLHQTQRAQGTPHTPLRDASFIDTSLRALPGFRFLEDLQRRGVIPQAMIRPTGIVIQRPQPVAAP